MATKKELCRSASGVFVPNLGWKIDPQELQLARTLIQASATEEADLGKYQDLYTEKLAKLIEAKVAGKELVSPPPSKDAQVINLMDALKQSLAQVQKAGGGTATTGERSPQGPEPPAKKSGRKTAPRKRRKAA